MLTPADDAELRHMIRKMDSVLDFAPVLMSAVTEYRAITMANHEPKSPSTAYAKYIYFKDRWNLE